MNKIGKDAGERVGNSKFMLHVLPKQKKQSSDVNTFDWLNLRHVEK